MKKIISTFAFILLIVTAFCVFSVGSFAEESDAKIKIGAYLLDGTKVEVSQHDNMEEGWHAAISLANDDEVMESNGYLIVSVDFLDDWTAEDGDFSTNSKYSNVSFSGGALYIPRKALVEINLNGHTLDRGLDDYRYNGEVICVDQQAHLIINGGSNANDAKMGKVTGGFSCNGAGGIHIHDKAQVLLNNVSVSGNCTEDDDGAGIALYNGAKLTVNGGEISNNTTYTSDGVYWAQALLGVRAITRGAGVYVKDASASFDNVTFTKNAGAHGDRDEAVQGDVISSLNSTVTMRGCEIFENSIRNENNELYSDVFYIEKSDFTLENCKIYRNGSELCYLFNSVNSTLTINKSDIYENGCNYVILSRETKLTMNSTKIHDNEGGVLLVHDDDTKGEIVKSTFDNNSTKLTSKDSFNFEKKMKNLSFNECDFGNSTFKNKDYAQYNSNLAGTISAEGSIATVISVVALLLSGATLALVLVNNKKQKTVKAADSQNTEDAE